MQKFLSFVKPFWKWIDFSSPQVINSFKTALACLIGYALILWTPLPQSQWIVITILVVMSAQTSIGSLFIKAKMRFWGTVGGALASIAIIFLCDNQPAAVAIAFFIVTLIFAYIAGIPGDVSYVGTLGAVTVAMIILTHDPGIEVASARFIEISLGIIIAFLVSQFVFPIRSHTLFVKNLAATLFYLHEYFDRCFQEHTMDANEPVLDTNEKILGIFSQQRRLIHEIGAEIGRFRKNKHLFQQAFNAERRIYRAINIMHYSFHAAPESRKIIQSLPGFEQFKQEVSQALVQLSLAVKSSSVTEINFSFANLTETVDSDFKNISNVHAFLFGAKFLINELTQSQTCNIAIFKLITRNKKA